MKIYFVLFVFALSSIACAKESSETEILKIYAQASSEHRKFVADEIQNRKDFEDFGENIFQPSAQKMAKEMDSGKCQKCLRPYLEALSYFSGGTSEALWGNLNFLIRKHPDQLSAACKSADKQKLKHLKANFLSSFDILKAEGLAKNELSELQRKISACYR